MTRLYLSGDKEREIREAFRQGRSLEWIAGQLGADAAELARLLDLPHSSSAVTDVRNPAA